VKHFIIGTLQKPLGLIRSDHGPPFVAERYNSAIDDFVRDEAAGRWILLGDTMLTEIPDDQVDDIRARIRIRNRGTQALA
jgi:hypothetical protein